MKRTKIYFASDAHLGAPYIRDPKKHEALFVSWLTMASADAAEIYLLGDIFDFWWEYKHVVPRGFVRTLGKIAEISDMGIIVHFFIGNHDIWLRDYLSTECGVIVHKKEEIRTIGEKKFYIVHGDGLGDPDKGFRLARAAFHSTFLQWAFSTFVHPSTAVGLARKWSGESRKTNDKKHKSVYLGEENEYLVKWAKKELKHNDINYFVFGHRHIPLNMMLSKTSSVIILGDFVRLFTYALFDNNEMQLHNFINEDEDHIINVLSSQV